MYTRIGNPTLEGPTEVIRQPRGRRVRASLRVGDGGDHGDGPLPAQSRRRAGGPRGIVRRNDRFHHRTPPPIWGHGPGGARPGRPRARGGDHRVDSPRATREPDEPVAHGPRPRPMGGGGRPGGRGPPGRQHVRHPAQSEPDRARRRPTSSTARPSTSEVTPTSRPASSWELERLVGRIDAKGYFGATADPFVGFLLNRGLKTLALRVARQK